MKRTIVLAATFLNYRNKIMLEMLDPDLCKFVMHDHDCTGLKPETHDIVICDTFWKKPNQHQIVKELKSRGFNIC